MDAANTVLQRIDSIRQDIRTLTILGLAATRVRLGDQLMRLVGAVEPSHAFDSAIVTLDAALGVLYESIDAQGFHEGDLVEAARVAAIQAVDHLECVWLNHASPPRAPSNAA